MLSNDRIVVAFAWLGIVMMVATILVVGRDVLIPLAIAILIWHLINALGDLYHRVRIRGQTAPNWARLTLAVITILVLLGIVVEVIVDNVGSVAAAAPVYDENLRKLLPQVFALFGQDEPPTLSQLIARIDIGGYVGLVSAALAGLVGDIGLIALYVAFMLFEQEMFDRKVDLLFADPERAARIRSLLGHIERQIEKYLWIKTVAGIAKALPSYLILVLVGVDYAGFWGLLVFLVHFIPTIGSVLGVALPALLAFLQFADLGTLAIVTVALSLVQFTISDIVEPKMMGDTLNLSPVVVILALAVWSTIWGIAGMFLCVPITAIIIIVCAHFDASRPVAVLLSAKGRVQA